MSTPNPKPLPAVDDVDTAPFWQGTRNEQLLVKRCEACGRHQWPPRLGCSCCGSLATKWVATAPKGEIFSWTIIHRSQTPGFEADAPYAVVLVALAQADGVRMIGNLVDCPVDSLAAGLAVEAVFTPSADGAATLVNWRPAAATPA